MKNVSHIFSNQYQISIHMLHGFLLLFLARDSAMVNAYAGYPCGKKPE